MLDIGIRGGSPWGLSQRTAEEKAVSAMAGMNWDRASREHRLAQGMDHREQVDAADDRWFEREAQRDAERAERLGRPQTRPNTKSGKARPTKPAAKARGLQPAQATAAAPPDLVELVHAVVRGRPGLTARQITSEVARRRPTVTKGEVNSALYSYPRIFAHTGKPPAWTASDGPLRVRSPKKKKPKAKPAQKGTPKASPVNAPKPKATPAAPRAPKVFAWQKKTSPYTPVPSKPRLCKGCGYNELSCGC